MNDKDKSPQELGLKGIKGGCGGTIYPRVKGCPAPKGGGKPKGVKNKKTMLNELFTYLSDPTNKGKLSELGFGSAHEFISFSKKAGLDPLMAKQIQLAFGTKKEIIPDIGEVIVDINPDIQRKAVADLLDRVDGKPIATQLTADISKDEVLEEILDELSEVV